MFFKNYHIDELEFSSFNKINRACVIKKKTNRDACCHILEYKKNINYIHIF